MPILSENEFMCPGCRIVFPTPAFFHAHRVGLGPNRRCMTHKEMVRAGIPPFPVSDIRLDEDGRISKPVEKTSRRVPVYKLEPIPLTNCPPEIIACRGKSRDEVDLYLQAHGFSPVRTLMKYKKTYRWVG